MPELTFDIKQLPREQLIRLAEGIQAFRIRKQRDPLSFFEPYDYQEEFWISEKKDKTILGGNRSGKTENGAAYVVDYCLEHPKARVWACTWADLSISVQQAAVYKFLPKDGRVKYGKYSEQNGFANRIIIFENGSFIRFKTYDQGWLSYQGASRHLIWDDEEPPEDVLKEQRLRLVDTNGELIRTMTPLQGFTYTYKEVVINRKEDGTVRNQESAFWYWNTYDNKSLKKEVLDYIIGQYSAREAVVRTKGKFLDLRSGRMYREFARELNISKEPLKIDRRYPIRLSFDFNVNPMITIIAQIIPGRKAFEQGTVLKIIKVIATPDCTTGRQCQLIQAELQDYEGIQLVIYGDATKQRRTERETADVNVTNWTIVRKFFPGAIYKVPNFNPAIVERVAWGNAKLRNLNGEIGVLLNQTGCNVLFEDFEQVIFDRRGTAKDKTLPELTHASDAYDYIISQEFKMKEPAAAYQSALGTQISSKKVSRIITAEEGAVK